MQSCLQGILPVLPRKGRHLFDLLTADPVLHELGEHRLDLVDHSGPVDPPAQDLQIIRAA